MKKTKAKKILSIFIVLILLISTSIFLYATSVIEDPVNISFEDKNLYDAIKFYFQAEGMKYKTNDAELILTASEAQLNLVEELNLKGTEGAKITDITGLQSFINLKKVNLSDNNITDITPLQTLTKLISIDFSNNSRINIYNKNNNSCYLPNQSTLQELNIASTNNSDITFVSNLTNLKVLNVSNNGVSVLTPLKRLQNLNVLDISSNTSITTIDDIIQLTSLKELNIATTGITDLLVTDYDEEENNHGIFNLRNLEVLNVENNKLSIEPVYYTYENSSGDEVVYLRNIKKLNFNYTGQSDVDYSGLALLTELTHLYMKGNEIEYVDDSIATLRKLEYINLSENNIEDISGFILYGDEDQIESTLAAKQIVLEHNRIQDIEPLGKLGHDITYLDLSSNLIFYKIGSIDYGKFTFSEGLDLTRQGLDKFDEDGNPEKYYFEIKKKEAKINQYMILPPLFQNSKDNASELYTDNITFSYENVKLNPDTKYHVPGDYNVIIEPPEESDDDGEEEIQQKTLSVTLNGGCADGSKMYYYYTEDESSTDSLLFKDPKLATAVKEEIMSQIDDDDELFITEAQDILNLTNSLIVSTTTLHIEDKGITDLTGLASFENLTHVYLSNNNIPSIDELKYCKEMSELYVSNNPNLGNNITAIEEMIQITKLDLSSIGMTNLQSIQKLISNCQNEEEFLLTYLNISNNKIGNIYGIGSISSLEDLYISNIGINDITEIKPLTNLKTLNISGNEIAKINILKSLTKLKFLTMSNNKIEDITPISGISLDSLDFSNNKVKDVSSLTKSYTTLKMDSNQISDISNFESKLIGQFSAKNQMLSTVINGNETENIIISLPAIFKSSRQSGSKVYSGNSFVLANCELASDGNSIVVNPTQLEKEVATVKINGGNAHLTTFTIAAPLKGTITYNPSNEIKTNQDITATITFNRNNVTITNNDGKNTYKFTQNGQFTFEYMDESGIEGTSTAMVNNIDKVVPQSIEILKDIVNKNVVVTIKVSEPILQPEGWTLASNALSITKTYTQDANETVNLIDEAGNIGTVKVEVKIDKTAPVITGVENNQKYKKSVTPVIQDENLDKVTLVKEGTVVESYKIGDRINKVGQYVLTATDKFENTTTVSFEIEEILDIITSEKVTVIEEQQIIKDLKPETTVAEMKNIIQSDAEYEIIDKNGNTISETSKIGTGYKVKMETGKTYTIIVRGDSNGDGNADLRDILVINKHRLKKASLTGEYLQAGDVNEDGKSDLRDILQINKYRLGKINEL